MYPPKYWHILLFIYLYVGINRIKKCTFQRRRCCAFDSPGLPNDSAGYPGLVDIVRGTTPSVLRFLCVIRHESPRYTHAFTEKAQHLWRWISLRALTRGRLVPRQPRAIKGTTRTELHGENIYIAKFIHWNNGTIPTALRRYNIHHGGYIHWNIGTFGRLFIRTLVSIILWNECFNAVGVALSIAQGCQTIVQATLG